LTTYVLESYNNRRFSLYNLGNEATSKKNKKKKPTTQQKSPTHTTPSCTNLSTLHADGHRSHGSPDTQERKIVK